MYITHVCGEKWIVWLIFGSSSCLTSCLFIFRYVILSDLGSIRMQYRQIDRCFNINRVSKHGCLNQNMYRFSYIISLNQFKWCKNNNQTVNLIILKHIYACTAHTHTNTQNVEVLIQQRPQSLIVHWKTLSSTHNCQLFHLMREIRSGYNHSFTFVSTFICVCRT